MWHDGAVYFAMVECVPVNILEPRMRFHCAGSAFDVTKAFGGVDGTESGDQITSIRGHCRGESNSSFYNSKGMRVRM